MYIYIYIYIYVNCSLVLAADRTRVLATPSGLAGSGDCEKIDYVQNYICICMYIYMCVYVYIHSVLTYLPSWQPTAPACWQCPLG